MDARASCITGLTLCLKFHHCYKAILPLLSLIADCVSRCLFQVNGELVTILFVYLVCPTNKHSSTKQCNVYSVSRTARLVIQALIAGLKLQHYTTVLKNKNTTRPILKTCTKAQYTSATNKIES